MASSMAKLVKTFWYPSHCSFTKKCWKAGIRDKCEEPIIMQEQRAGSRTWRYSSRALLSSDPYYTVCLMHLCVGGQSIAKHNNLRKRLGAHLRTSTTRAYICEAPKYTLCVKCKRHGPWCGVVHIVYDVVCACIWVRVSCVGVYTCTCTSVGIGRKEDLVMDLAF